jgi:hypothetical protein
MSNDERDAAILRLVKTRAEAKKRKNLLETELRNLLKNSTESRNMG